MKVQELINALTALPLKDRDVAVHIHGELSGILDVRRVNDASGYGDEVD